MHHNYVRALSFWRIPYPTCHIIVVDEGRKNDHCLWMNQLLFVGQIHTVFTCLVLWYSICCSHLGDEKKEVHSSLSTNSRERHNFIFYLFYLFWKVLYNWCLASKLFVIWNSCTTRRHQGAEENISQLVDSQWDVQPWPSHKREEPVTAKPYPTQKNIRYTLLTTASCLAATTKLMMPK